MARPAVWLRQGVTFHEHWGEFTATDVRHAVFLITQPESVQSDASNLADPDGDSEDRDHRGGGEERGTGVRDRRRTTRSSSTSHSGARVRRDHLRQHRPVIESKARWTPGARRCTARRWWARALRIYRAQAGLARALQAGRAPLAPDSSVQRARVPLGAGGRHQAGHPAQWRSAHLRRAPGPCSRRRWPRGCRSS